MNPSDAATSQFQLRKRARKAQTEIEAKYRSVPAISAAGTRITVQINVEGEKSLDGLGADACDGIGLTRTEFLFQDVLADEEAQTGSTAASSSGPEGSR